MHIFSVIVISVIIVLHFHFQLHLRLQYRSDYSPSPHCPFIITIFTLTNTKFTAGKLSSWTWVNRKNICIIISLTLPQGQESNLLEISTVLSLIWFICFPIVLNRRRWIIQFTDNEYSSLLSNWNRIDIWPRREKVLSKWII